MSRTKHMTEQEIIADHAPSVRPRARMEMRIVNALIARAEEVGATLTILNYDPTCLSGDLRTDVFDLEVVRVGISTGGWVELVFGNTGWDLISNYTLNADSLLHPVLELSKRLGVNESKRTHRNSDFLAEILDCCHGEARRM